MNKELTKWIAGKTSLTVGTTIFSGYRPPAAPERCAVVIVREATTLYPVPSQMEVSLQIITRDKTDPAAEKLAYQIHNKLSRLLGGYSVASVDGMEATLYINAIETLAAPTSIGVDDRGLHEYSIRYVLQVTGQGAYAD